jgi:hypothetical protein
VFSRENLGFDAIVGNPPFLSGSRTSQLNGATYFQYLLMRFEGARHQCDLVAFFFRLSFALLRRGGAAGLVATKTVAQGDTRASSLEKMISDGAAIYRVQKRLPWPGEAAVIVSPTHFIKGNLAVSMFDGRPVARISAFLLPGDVDSAPFRLAVNPYFSKGSQVYGQGFVFDDTDPNANPVSALQEIREYNESRIFPMFGGIDLNQQPVLTPQKWVVNVSDINSEDELKRLPTIYRLLRSKVKPERDRLPDNANNKPLKRRWWAYQAPRPELYRRLSLKKRCIAHAEISPHLEFRIVETGPIYIKTAIIIDSEHDGAFAVLQSRTHEIWARFFASTLEDRLRYTPSDCFETFPLPDRFETSPALEAAGRAYHDHRAAVMFARGEGMTKTYNHFHSPVERGEDIVRLRELHAEMDRAALRAYHWDDLATRAEPIFLDETNEDDHAYHGRLFWPSAFRDEVLARLLTLNAERHAEESRLGVASGTYEKARDEEEQDKEDASVSA